MSTASPPVDIIAAFGDRQARLEERVTGLEGDLRTVLSAVNGLGDKLDKRATPQWGVMFAGLGILIGIVGYVGNAWREPLINRQDAQAAEIRTLQGNLVPRAEVAGYVASAQRDNDLIRLRIERFEARVSKEIDRLNGTVFVPAWGKRS